MEKDLREVKVKRRQQKTLDREEWASVIKESKALRGPQSQGVSIRAMGRELSNFLFEISTGYICY